MDVSGRISSGRVGRGGFGRGGNVEADKERVEMKGRGNDSRIGGSDEGVGR